MIFTGVFPLGFPFWRGRGRCFRFLRVRKVDHDFILSFRGHLGIFLFRTGGLAGRIGSGAALAVCLCTAIRPIAGRAAGRGFFRLEIFCAVPAGKPADAQDGNTEDSQRSNDKAFGLKKLLHV